MSAPVIIEAGSVEAQPANHPPVLPGPGQGLCRTCSNIKPETEFLKHDKGWCKSCAQKYQTAKYLRNKQYYVDHAEQRRLANLELRREFLALLLDRPCTRCGDEPGSQDMRVHYEQGRDRGETATARVNAGHSEELVLEALEAGTIVCAHCALSGAITPPWPNRAIVARDPDQLRECSEARLRVGLAHLMAQTSLQQHLLRQETVRAEMGLLLDPQIDVNQTASRVTQILVDNASRRIANLTIAHEILLDLVNWKVEASGTGTVDLSSLQSLRDLISEAVSLRLNAAVYRRIEEALDPFGSHSSQLLIACLTGKQEHARRLISAGHTLSADQLLAVATAGQDAQLCLPVAVRAISANGLSDVIQCNAASSLAIQRLQVAGVRVTSSPNIWMRISKVLATYAGLPLSIARWDAKKIAFVNPYDPEITQRLISEDQHDSALMYASLHGEITAMTALLSSPPIRRMIATRSQTLDWILYAAASVPNGRNYIAACHLVKAGISIESIVEDRVRDILIDRLGRIEQNEAAKDRKIKARAAAHAFNALPRRRGRPRADAPVEPREQPAVVDHDHGISDLHPSERDEELHSFNETEAHEAEPAMTDTSNNTKAVTPTYLTTELLAERIHYDARTIRDRLVNTVMREGVHYIRPFGGRKILFIWEAIQRDMAVFSLPSGPSAPPPHVAAEAPPSILSAPPPSHLAAESTSVVRPGPGTFNAKPAPVAFGARFAAVQGNVLLSKYMNRGLSVVLLERIAHRAVVDCTASGGQMFFEDRFKTLMLDLFLMAPFGKSKADLGFMKAMKMPEIAPRHPATDEPVARLLEPATDGEQKDQVEQA